MESSYSQHLDCDMVSRGKANINILASKYIQTDAWLHYSSVLDVY